MLINSHFYVKKLLKYNGKTIGVELINIRTNEIRIIERNRFNELVGILTNADVLKNGVIRGIKGKLPVKNVTESEMLELLNAFKVKRKINQNEIRRYTIMWEDTKILYFNKETDEFKIYNEKFLPFGLKNSKNIKGSMILEWIRNRVTNIHRTYMNLIYIARQVGRDMDKVIADSAGLSIIDHFWIKTTDTNNLKWSDLQRLKDKNEELNRVAIEGILKGGKALKEDYTSLFTLKGYYPKYACDGFLYKRKKDAIKEYPAYLIAKQLKLPIAECELQDELIKIQLFVNDSVSLVHAQEIAQCIDYAPALLSDAFAALNRPDLVEQIDLLYIFNYLIGNVDLHAENFGFLFNNKTFKIVSIAPFFDHNMSFNLEFIGETGNLGINIEQWSKNAIIQYPQFCNLLHKLDLTVVKPYISKDEYAEFVNRYEKLIKWSENKK